MQQTTALITYYRICIIALGCAKLSIITSFTVLRFYTFVSVKFRMKLIKCAIYISNSTLKINNQIECLIYISKFLRLS